MPLGADLAGPVEYARWWPMAGAFALAAALLWYAGVLWFTRHETAVPVEPPRPLGAREATLAAIDDLVRATRAGQITTRAAHERLSTLVRAFVRGQTGLPTDTMTLSDLHLHRVPQLTELVAVLYPRQFGPAEADDAVPVLLAGRDLVATWP